MMDHITEFCVVYIHDMDDKNKLRENLKSNASFVVNALRLLSLMESITLLPVDQKRQHPAAFVRYVEGTRRATSEFPISPEFV
jgi:hypothetical protein